MSLERNRWSDKTKVLAANAVVTYDEHLPRAPINAIYHENTEGDPDTNGFVSAGISRYESKIGTEQYLDVLPVFLRALFDPLYRRAGGKPPGAADLAWEFDFSLFSQLLPKMQEGDRRRDATVGLPGDSLKKWTTRQGAAGTAGVGLIGYEECDEPDFIPYLKPHTFSDLVDGAAVKQRHELMWEPLLCAGVVMDLADDEVAAEGFEIIFADKGGVLQVSNPLILRRQQLLAKLRPFTEGDIADPVFIPFDQPRIVEKHSVMYLWTEANFVKTQEILPVMFKVNPRGPLALGRAKVAV